MASPSAEHAKHPDWIKQEPELHFSRVIFQPEDYWVFNQKEVESMREGPKPDRQDDKWHCVAEEIDDVICLHLYCFSSGRESYRVNVHHAPTVRPDGSKIYDGFNIICDFLWNHDICAFDPQISPNVRDKCITNELANILNSLFELPASAFKNDLIL